MPWSDDTINLLMLVLIRNIFHEKGRLQTIKWLLYHFSINRLFPGHKIQGKELHHGLKINTSVECHGFFDGITGTKPELRQRNKLTRRRQLRQRIQRTGQKGSRLWWLERRPYLFWDFYLLGPVGRWHFKTSLWSGVWGRTVSLFKLIYCNLSGYM